MVRDGQRVVHNDVRLAYAQNQSMAREAATQMVADGFTAWIFKIDREAGKKTYHLLDVMAKGK